MEDFNIAIKQPDETEITANTDMIEEDVIRMAIGLQRKNSKEGKDANV